MHTHTHTHHHHTLSHHSLVSLLPPKSTLHSTPSPFADTGHRWFRRTVEWQQRWLDEQELCPQTPMVGRCTHTYVHTIPNPATTCDNNPQKGVRWTVPRKQANCLRHVSNNEFVMMTHMLHRSPVYPHLPSLEKSVVSWPSLKEVGGRLEGEPHLQDHRLLPQPLQIGTRQSTSSTIQPFIYVLMKLAEKPYLGELLCYSALLTALLWQHPYTRHSNDGDDCTLLMAHPLRWLLSGSSWLQCGLLSKCHGVHSAVQKVKWSLSVLVKILNIAKL